MTDRREFLLGALAAPLLSTIPQGRRAPTPRPRDRDFIIEASWGLIFRDSAGVLVPDISVRVRGADIVEVREGRIAGSVARQIGRAHV